MWSATRVTVEYFTKDGEKKRIKLKGYNSIVVQHEIDHTNGIMFYDRINPNNPFEILYLYHLPNEEIQDDSKSILTIHTNKIGRLTEPLYPK